MNIHVHNIKWDLEDEETGLTVDINEEGLPTEIDIEVENEDDIAEVLSEKYGFSVESFDYDRTKTDIELVKDVLRRYFEYLDNGEASPKYDEYFSAEEAIDEIHDIIGYI